MKKVLVSILAITSFGGAVAQSNSIEGGALTKMSNFKTTDMLAFSQYDYTLGTARSSAMGGAFTALGADLASMSINPAGLGMYRSSEFSISPSLSFSKMNNSRAGGIDNLSGNKTNFALGNVGIALNLYQGSGALTSFTLGFGYNKLVDFNSRNTFGMAPDSYSIVDMMALQLRGIDPEALASKSNPYNNSSYPTDLWGAILGYQTSLVDPIDGNMYSVNAILPTATNSHYADFTRKGYLGEYNISGGFNFSNKLYMGFSLGVQDIDYRMTAEYQEAYVDNNPTDPKFLDYMSYNQYMKMSGTGVNFKFGLTAQPVEGLRIGVAVHTPTYVSVERVYEAGMYTQFNPNPNGTVDTGDRSTPPNAFTPKFTSPARLLTGVSYTFGGMAILSVDYERAWYNGMRLKTDDSYANADYKSQSKNDFKGQNSIRVGLEVKPMDALALRAGYFNTGSMLSDNALVFNDPVAYRQQGFALGIGYRVNSFSLDLAYAMKNVKYTEYDLYYYDGPNNDNQDVVISTGGIHQKMDHHNITLTMGFRF